MRFLCVLLTSLLIAGGALAAGEPVVDVLDNGLALIVKENHTAPVVSVRIYVGTGSCYEGEYLGSGISHLVEHTIDGGTPTRTGEEIDAAVESIGNASNAFTSMDETSFYISTSAQYLKTALELLSDYVFHPTFPEEVVEREKGVILREMAMGDDEPGNRLWDLFNATMFRVHPARNRIIGYPERFRTLTRDDVVRYHSRAYVPENAVVAVAGDVKADETLALCRELLAPLPRSAAQIPIPPEEPPQTAARSRAEVDGNLDQAYLEMGVRTVDLLHPDLFALDVASYVLSNGASSRLVRTLRDERGLVSSIDTSSYTPPNRPGMLVASAVLDPKNIGEAETAIWAEMRRLCDGAVTKEELARAKAQKAAELVFGNETAEQQADRLAADYLATGNANFSEDYVSGIGRVTAKDIQRVAQTYFRDDHLCTVVLTPRAPRERKGEEEAQAGLSVERIVLDNGLTVLLGVSHGTPTVSVTTATLGGVRAETAESNGITQLMTSCLLRGTTTRTRDEIARTLEDVGGSVDTYAGRNSFGVRATALSANLDRAVALVADVLRNPVFPEGEVARVRELTLAGLKAEKDDVFATATRLFTRTMYTQHPYGMMPAGTEESVSALRRDDLVAFHQAYCRPGATVVAVYGDFDPAAARALVSAAFGNWPAGEPAAIAPAPEPSLTESRQVTQESAQQQAVIYMGFPGPKIADDDFYAREVMDAMLSGKGLPGGPLHNTLRGRQLVYMVHAFSADGLEPGHFAIVAATAPETVDQALAAIREVVTQFQSTVPDAAALETGKRMCIAENALGRQEVAAIAQEAALDQLYGLGYDRGDHYAERIQAVTAEDVHRVANALLTLDRCVTVVVGPKASQ